MPHQHDQATRAQFRKARRAGAITARQQRKRLKAYRAMEKLLNA